MTMKIDLAYRLAVLAIDYFQCYNNSSWVDCSSLPYTNLLGSPVVGMLLIIPTSLALWMQSKSIIVPGSLLVLLVGVLFGGVLPAGVAYVIYAVITVALTLGYRSIAVGR